MKYKILREKGGNEHAPDWRDDGIFIIADSEDEAIEKAEEQGIVGYELLAIQVEGE